MEYHITKIEYYNTEIGNTQGYQDWNYDRRLSVIEIWKKSVVVVI